MSGLKPCPFRVHGERLPSATIKDAFFYNETFMPCMRHECPCFIDDGCDYYCDRNGSFIKLGEKD